MSESDKKHSEIERLNDLTHQIVKLACELDDNPVLISAALKSGATMLENGVAAKAMMGALANALKPR